MKCRTAALGKSDRLLWVGYGNSMQATFGQIQSGAELRGQEL
jgi:hypothetical protein